MALRRRTRDKKKELRFSGIGYRLRPQKRSTWKRHVLIYKAEWHALRKGRLENCETGSRSVHNTTPVYVPLRPSWRVDDGGLKRGLLDGRTWPGIAKLALGPLMDGSLTIAALLLLVNVKASQFAVSNTILTVRCEIIDSFEVVIFNRVEFLIYIVWKMKIKWRVNIYSEWSVERTNFDSNCCFISNIQKRIKYVIRRQVKKLKSNTKTISCAKYALQSLKSEIEAFHQRKHLIANSKYSKTLNCDPDI